MSKQYDFVALAGRILIGVVFLMSGTGKLVAPAATIAYIAHANVPVPVGAYAVSLAVEVVGAILIIVGFQSRLVAAGMAVFTLAAAAFFHNHWADRNQFTHFMKNMSMMGGMLQIVAFGGGKYALDRVLERRSGASAEAILQPAR